MVRGEEVNPTEGRAALHTALRARPGDQPAAPASVQQAVAAERERLRDFAVAIRSGAWTGANGHASATSSTSASAAATRGRGSCARHSGMRPTARACISPATSMVPCWRACCQTWSLQRRWSSCRAELLDARNATERGRGPRVAGSGRIAGSRLAAAHGGGFRQRRRGGVARLAPGESVFLLGLGGRALQRLERGWLAGARGALGRTRFDALLDGARDMDRHALESPLAHNCPPTMALLENLERRCTSDAYALRRPTMIRSRRCSLAAATQMEPWQEPAPSMVRCPMSRPPRVVGGVGTDAQHTFLNAFARHCSARPWMSCGVEQPEHGVCRASTRLLSVANAQRAGRGAGRVETIPGANAVASISITDRLTPERLGSLMALLRTQGVMEAALLRSSIAVRPAGSRRGWGPPPKVPGGGAWGRGGGQKGKRRAQ